MFRRIAVGAAIAVVFSTVAAVCGTHNAMASGTTYPVTCLGIDDTSAIQQAVDTAQLSAGNTVSIASGTCALSNNINVNGANGVTITGAGESLTSLVQHARVDIFGIHTPGVTVRDMDVNTATYNTTYPPISGNPDPPTIYSNASYTSVRDLSSESGTGFGFRLAGTEPCDSHPATGGFVSNVNVTNLGVGGFSSIDVDCEQSATIKNVTVHGASITPYRNLQTTLDGVTYTAGPYGITCEPAWQVDQGTATISNVVTHNGWGNWLGGATGTVTNETLAPGDTCPAR